MLPGHERVDKHHGLTTPDPDEAYVKQLALRFSDERFVLCDSDKFSRVTFAKVADLREVTVITDDGLSQEEQRVQSINKSQSGESMSLHSNLESFY